MIRKALREKLEREAQEKLWNDLQNLTEKEIKEEIAVIRHLLEVKKAWEEYQTNGEVPKLVYLAYEHIFDSFYSKKDYEPNPTLKKEMISLSLIDYLFKPLIEKDSYGHRYKKIWSWFFVRVVINYQKGHTTWVSANRALRQIQEVIPYKEKIKRVIDRLLERLSEIKEDSDLITKEKLISPLADLLKSEEQPQALIQKIERIFKKENWLIEIYKTAREAEKRLEAILLNLPNPKEIPCEEARRRIIEIYESDLQVPFTSIQTLKDGAVLDHIEECLQYSCQILRRCVSTVFSYKVVRKWSDQPESYTREAIEEIKKQLFL